jgi:arsenite oxidase large subunit
MALIPRRDQLPIPPKTAKVYNTVCQYCNVGCGYKVYVWPVGEQGGPKPNQNAFGLDLSQPQPPLAGQSYTETMHAVTVGKDGRQYHVVMVPAKDSPINRGDYSIRGGTNALTVWSLDRGTQDRLTYPLLRVGDQFQAITWQDALTFMGLLIKGIRDRDGNDDNIAVKCYDHGGSGQGFEDNYGAGKLFFSALSVKHIAIHNRPAYNSEVWGSRERGVHELNYDYFRRPPRRHYRPLGGQPLRDGHGLLRGAHAPQHPRGHHPGEAAGLREGGARRGRPPHRH